MSQALRKVDSMVLDLAAIVKSRVAGRPWIQDCYCLILRIYMTTDGRKVAITVMALICETKRLEEKTGNSCQFGSIFLTGKVDS